MENILSVILWVLSHFVSNIVLFDPLLNTTRVRHSTKCNALSLTPFLTQVS